MYIHHKFAFCFYLFFTVFFALSCLQGSPVLLAVCKNLRESLPAMKPRDFCFFLSGCVRLELLPNYEDKIPYMEEYLQEEEEVREEDNGKLNKRHSVGMGARHLMNELPLGLSQGYVCLLLVLSYHSLSSSSSSSLSSFLVDFSLAPPGRSFFLSCPCRLRWVYLCSSPSFHVCRYPSMFFKIERSGVRTLGRAVAGLSLLA